ncbi:MAG: hypothetical protein PHT84_03590 [Candidatus Pacebacteria bacterium]|nr:hypothetical protein [Candidatus Paceibacterota bacterium]
MEEENKQPNNNSKINPKNIHTYMSDMADVVRENEMSVIKVAMAEQRSRERGDYYERNKETPKKKFLFVLGGLFIILIGVFASYFLIQKAKEKNAPVEIVKTIIPLISYDNSVELDATLITNKIDLSNLINPEIKSGETPNTIKAFFLNQKTEESKTQMGLSSLLKTMNITTAPGSLTRSFSEEYMIGTYATTNPSDKSHLFLMIKINDYEPAFAGMLEWEKTILGDLFSFFQINIKEKDNYLFEKTFKDIMIKNKDVRVLYDDNNQGVLYYFFPSKEHLVITDNQEAIEEIITRILVGQTKPQ